MAGPFIYDRVKESTTTTGSGTLTLAGAVTGFRSFSVVGNTNTCFYCIENGVDWEVGLGTYTTAGTTLSRDTILASSNSGAAVNWGAGTKSVFIPVTASWTGAPFTAGSVVFAGTNGVLAQDNTKLFFDNTNDYLAIGLGTPTSRLHVAGNSTDIDQALIAGTPSWSVTAKAMFAVTGSPTPTAAIGTCYGIRNIQTFTGTEGVSTNTITTVHGIFSRQDTAASYDSTITSLRNFTAAYSTHAGGAGITGATGFFAQNPSAPTGGAITNLHGAYVEALTRGTNNYGVYVNAPSGGSGVNYGYFGTVGTPNHSLDRLQFFNISYSGNYVVAYSPIEVYSTYTSNNVTDPFIQSYSGITSTIYYGSQSPSTAAKGTNVAMVSQIFVRNSGDTEDEHAPYFGVLRYDSNNNAFGNTTPGRAWMCDFTVHGAISTQQGALGGVHMYMNNYYNGPPRDGLSAAYWATTRQGGGGAKSYYHELLDTYAIGVGYGVVGFSSGSFTRGYETGIQVGGAGSNWNIATSAIGCGVDVQDYDTAGIWLHAKFSGIAKIALTNGGTGYTGQPTVAFGAAPAGGATATGTVKLTATSVASFSVANGGSGYVSPPLVTVTDPFPSGTTATGTAVLTGDAVSSITLDSGGSGYIKVPTVTIAPPPSGTTATATAVMTATTVSGISLTNPGKGYTSSPSVTISGGSGSGATAFAIHNLSGTLKDVQITDGGGGYSTVSPPAVSFSGGVGTGGTLTLTTSAGVITSAVVGAAGSGYPLSSTVYVTIAGGTGGIAAVPTSGAGTLSGTVVILNGGSGYSNSTQATTNYDGTAGTAVINTNGKVVGIFITDPGAGYTTAPAVTIAAPSPVTALGKAITSGGALSAITITNAGTSYYSGAPTISFNNTGTGGTGAAATATVYFGVVKYTTITSAGSGYSRTGDSGSGGTITIVTSGGAITSASVGAGGSGYPISTTIRLGVAGGTNGVIELTTNGSGALAGAVTVANAGTGYSNSTQATFNVPIVTFTAPPAGSTATGTARITSYALKADIDAGPVVIDSGNPANVNSQQIAVVEKRLTADATTLNLTASNVTGMNFTVGANEVWTFEFNLRVGSATGTAGMKLAITFPAGATMLATAIGNTSSVTAFTSDLMTVSGTLGVAFHTYSGATGVVRITGTIVNGATAGTVQLQFAKVTSQTATVAANSFLTARGGVQAAAGGAV